MQEINDGLPSKAATYVDYRELIKDPNVGIVVIATPGYLHHEMALAVLARRQGPGAGEAALAELSRCHGRRSARRRRAAAIVAVGMQRRYSDGDAQFQAALDSGMIGPVRMINYSEYRGDWNPGTWQYPDPATGKKTSWRRLAKTAGSTELEFSIHALAMVTNMVKSPLVRLAATGGVVHYKDGRDTRDVVGILADFENGARLDYSFNLFAQGVHESLTVVGDKGHAAAVGARAA